MDCEKEMWQMLREEELIDVSQALLLEELEGADELTPTECIAEIVLRGKTRDFFVSWHQVNTGFYLAVSNTSFVRDASMVKYCSLQESSGIRGLVGKVLAVELYGGSEDGLPDAVMISVDAGSFGIACVDLNWESKEVPYVVEGFGLDDVEVFQGEVLLELIKKHQLDQLTCV